MEIFLLGYIAIFIVFLGFVEIFRSGKEHLSLYFNVFVVRMIIALLMYMFYGYVNPGGDALKYIEVSQSISSGLVTSLSQIVEIYNDDSRYILYLAICAALDFLFGPLGVILFQTCIHILSGFFIHLSLRKLGVSVRKSNFILVIYTFYPFLIFYSSIYLRDIYLVLATAWFVYGLIIYKGYFGKFFNMLVPLLIIIGFRVQYLPFYLLFFIGYYFFDKKNGIGLYQWFFILLGVILVSYWSDFLNMNKLIPYLVGSGEIEDNPSLAYSNYNALDYISITKIIQTFFGIFGPYHMFRGGDFVFVEYRGDYVERFFEGLSALLNITMLLSILWYLINQYFVGKNKFNVKNNFEDIRSQFRKSALLFFTALVILLSFVGYNRWKMPLIPILFLYFGVCSIKVSNFVLILLVVILTLTGGIWLGFLFNS